MSITREDIKETLRQIMSEESDYQKFFMKALEKAGKSIPSMSDEEKKEFFNKIDKAWSGKGEKKNEGNAFGAAVTKAKEKGEDEFEVDGKTYKVESVNEGKYNYKADALTAYFKGKIDAKELDRIARDDFKSGIATKKELSNFLSNKFTQDVMSDIYGIPAGTLIKRVRGLMKFAESVNEGVEPQIKKIAYFTGTRPEAVEDFVSKHALNITKLLKYVQKGGLPQRIELVSALAGRPNNPKQKKIIKQFQESVNEGRAFVQAARKAKEEGKTEFEFNGKTYPVTLKETTISERRLGKVDLLRSVEDGETSRVEGVKISKDLAFELRMFLQRPLLARTRTGIAIDNAQMKDAISMLAKVGVHKRLSSGVKKEFADLLKKYK